MRVAHGVGWFDARSVGGTERYVESLCLALARKGLCNTVVAPGHAAGHEVVRGVYVHRHPVEDRPDRAAMREPDAQAVGGFADLVASLGVDVFHQHSVTRAMGAPHLVAVKARGIATVHSLHTATPVCLRGTLLEQGSRPCDGEVRIGRCASCWLQSRGRSRAWSLIPRAVGRVALERLPGARAATALGTRHLVGRHRRDLQTLLRAADRTVVFADWQRRILEVNGFSVAEVRTVRHGIDPLVPDAPDLARGPKLEVLFVGRLEPMKGLGILLDAVEPLLADRRAALTIHGQRPPSGSPHESFALGLLERARKLGATVVEGAPRVEVERAYARADILAIPSMVLETGPLVALEAIASGAFVLGSRLGGIAEMLANPALGELIPPGDVVAWRCALQRAVVRRDVLRTARKPRAVRSMDDVAADMLAIYRDVAAHVSAVP